MQILINTSRDTIFSSPSAFLTIDDFGLYLVSDTTQNFSYTLAVSDLCK